jgi:hypothetical protein
MTDVEAKVQEMVDALVEVAKVATVMVDGEEATHIISDRAYFYLANPDPKHRFLSSDYYDVDAPNFLRMKKTLLRLSMLVDFPCDTSLWVKVKGPEDHVTVAVQNGNLKRYWKWAEEKRPVEGEMAEALSTGEVTVAPVDDPSGTITVLAPVRDSLGDVVGLVELTARHPAATGPTPDWS